MSGLASSSAALLAAQPPAMCRTIALLSRYRTRSFCASTCLPRAASAASLLPSASNLSTWPMPSLYVAQPPSDSSATTTTLRHALACMVIDAPALRSHTAARDVFLDLLLPAPHLAVVREADQGEVHLIETHLAFAFGVVVGVVVVFFFVFVVVFFVFVVLCFFVCVVVLFVV